MAGHYGYAEQLRAADPAAARAADEVLDAALREAGYPEQFADRITEAPRRRILTVLTAAPETVPDAERIVAALKTSRHRVGVVLDSRRDLWKFVKINQAVQAHSEHTDWLLIVDHDVAFGPGFLDNFIDAAEAAGLLIAQPAHRIHSYASYAVTQRRPDSIVRTTHFVEIGPIVAIHRSLLPQIFPAPESRSGWGIDFIWADWARRHGWRIGVVDATPFEHLQPIGSSYPAEEAVTEAETLLAAHRPTITREEMLDDGAVAIGMN